MLNHLEVFCNNLVLCNHFLQSFTGSSPRASVEPCRLTWIPLLLKNRFLLSRILLLIEYSWQWVYHDYKQKCTGPISLPYEHPGNNYSRNPHKSGNRLPWISFLSMLDSTISLCRCWSLQMAFPPQFSRFLYFFSQ